MSFYIDPSSSKILELGTLEFPYTSAQPVFSEILNEHSHKDVSITVYLKEDEVVYIQDDTSYILNITNVTVTSYSTVSSSASKATIYPTRIAQIEKSAKSAFHIMNNMTLKLDVVVAAGIFTTLEIKTLSIGETTFLVGRSSFRVENINLFRDVIDVKRGTFFVRGSYLQEKWIIMKDINVNITGGIFYTADPASGHFENFYVDTFKMRQGIRFITS